MKWGIQAVWLVAYWYYIGRQGTIQKGIGRRIITAGIAAGLLCGFLLFDLAWPAWLLITGLFLLYDLFFDEEPFRYQWWGILLSGGVIVLLSLMPVRGQLIAGGALFVLLFILLAAKRGYLTVSSGVMVPAVYLLLSVQDVVPFTSLLTELLLFFTFETTLSSWKKSFDGESEHVMRDILGHQYEEIKTIYMNMRGWRHDYHNHIQVMKAQLAAGNAETLGHYLDELEQDLDRVDTYVKSGNRMVDAILNSKLSLAGQKQIHVNCKAQLPENISVEDVDLCVILGNLLDNALEACEKIPEENRFLRVYIVAHKNQLYVSIQNSAKEELNFDERHYITSKRGSHGFGMKRVQAMVEKYEGYLRLANEPGIFAAEVTMPL